MHTHTPKQPFVVVRSTSSANDAHKQTEPVLHLGKDSQIYTYSDAEQGGPDGGPSVQSSVDDQDETHS